MLTAMAADQRDCHQEQVSMVGCELALNSPGDQVQLLTCVMASDSEREMPGGLSAGQNHQTRPVKRGLPDELEVSSAIKRGKVSSTTTSSNNRVDLRLLVRRREAGALIGKQGANIKRMRDQYKSSTFNIPDTGNGPERVVCISADGWQSMASILAEISQLFLDKSAALNPIGEDQVELKQLVNSAYAGSLIGIGGQSIRKLRNESKAAIKIYEMCCPQSDERVCAIKARPPVVVATIRMIHEIMLASQSLIKAPLQAHSLYDALNFDLSQVDKYGGHSLDDCGPQPAMGDYGTLANGHHHKPLHLFQHHNPNSRPAPGLQHVLHFNAMARGDVGPLPFVMSPPAMLRPGLFFSPIQQIDFAPFHPLANGRQFAPVNQLNKRPRFSQTPNLLAADGQHYGPAHPVQPYRNQRLHPFQSASDPGRVPVRMRHQQPTPYSARPPQRPDQQARPHRPFGDGTQGDEQQQQQPSETNLRQSIGCSCSVVKSSCMETSRVGLNEPMAQLYGSSEAVVSAPPAVAEPLSVCDGNQQREPLSMGIDAAGNSAS